MTLESLLRLPRMENSAVDGVLYNTGLIDIPVEFFCNSMGVDLSLSDEEKRDAILPIILQGDPFGDTFNEDIFNTLKNIAVNYKESNNNVVSIEDYQDDMPITRAK